MSANELTYEERARIEAEADQKLKQAQALLDEAAKLAERGKFVLNFEGGTYVPTGLFDEEQMRPVAEMIAQAEGRPNWDGEYGTVDGKCGLIREHTRTPWAHLNEREQEKLVESVYEGLKENVDWQYAEYADKTSGGEWWTPSTC